MGAYPYWQAQSSGLFRLAGVVSGVVIQSNMKCDATGDSRRLALVLK